MRLGQKPQPFACQALWAVAFVPRSDKHGQPSGAYTRIRLTEGLELAESMMLAGS